MKCFWKHSWPQWQDVSEGPLIRSDDHVQVGHYVIQEKRCSECGKLKRRREKVMHV